jgi:hypothetical protein
MTGRDWYSWHADYDRPGSGLARRLAWVQDRIRAALDDAPPGPVRAISICAGQGRDLIGALAGHPRRGDVTARLVELDARNAETARGLAAAANLSGVEIVTGDAALTSQYTDLAPAGLVLACGVFGNITDDHIERTIDYCTRLCATGGTVVWTRARWVPDLVPQICAWFEERDFERVWLSEPVPGYRQCCGAHRFTGTPAPLEEHATMFAFTGHDVRQGPRRST